MYDESALGSVQIDALPADSAESLNHSCVGFSADSLSFLRPDSSYRVENKFILGFNLHVQLDLRLAPNIFRNRVTL